MAFRLSKNDATRRVDLEEKLSNAQSDMEEAAEDLRHKIDEMVDAFRAAFIEPYNAILQEACDFCDDIGREFRDQYDEKSERWQDSERGEAASDFTSAWEDASAEMSEEASVTVELEINIPAHSDILEHLPEEAE